MRKSNKRKPNILTTNMLKINILVSIIITAAFLAAVLPVCYACHNLSRKNTEQSAVLISEEICNRISKALSDTRILSLTMADDIPLRETLAKAAQHRGEKAFTEEMEERLCSYRKKNHGDPVVMLCTADGGCDLYYGQGSLLSFETPEDSWYSFLSENRENYAAHLGNPSLGTTGSPYVLLAGSKLWNDQGSLTGIVGAGLPLSVLQELLQYYETATGSKVTLSNSLGSGACLMDNGKANAGLSKECKILWNGPSCSASRYLPETGWLLTVEQFCPSCPREIFMQLLLILLMILLLLAVVLPVFSHTVYSLGMKSAEQTQGLEREHQTILEQVTSQLYENICELDVTNNRPANQAAEHYFAELGVPPGTPYDKALYIIASKQIKEEFRQGYLDMFLPQRVLRAYAEGQETLRYELLINQGDRDYYWIRITARIVRWESDGSLHLLVYRQNIDKEKKREIRIRELAQTDEMTGLLTKTATERQIDKLLCQGGHELYVFFIFDIDNFKQANDCYGHAFGDEVIKFFTRSLRSQFTKECLLGRIGGDEFAAFTPAPDIPWVRAKATQLSKVLCRTYKSGDKCWQISTSIGVYAAPGRENSFTSFYLQADKALYSTKNGGKNGYTLIEQEEAGRT